MQPTNSNIIDREEGTNQARISVDFLMDEKPSRKVNHKDAEKKRRDAIKKGYDMLLSVLPEIDEKNARSEAYVFEKCVNHLQWLEEENGKLKKLAAEHNIEFQ